MRPKSPRLLDRYARAVDTKDWELYRSVFTDDAHHRLLLGRRDRSGSRDEIVEWFSRRIRRDPVDHALHHQHRKPRSTGDTATVRAMFYNPMQLPGHGRDELLRRLLPPRTGAHRRRVAQPSTPRGERVVRQPTRSVSR